MSKAVRNILSFLILLVTSLCVIICAGTALLTKDNVYYDLIFDYPLEIKEVNAEKIGGVYMDHTSQTGKTFYKLSIVLENKTNSPIQRYPADYTIDAYLDGKPFGYVNRVSNDGMLLYYDSYLIPAGETGLVPVVAEVPDETEKIYIYEWNREGEKVAADLKK